MAIIKTQKQWVFALASGIVAFVVAVLGVYNMKDVGETVQQVGQNIVEYAPETSPTTVQ